MRLPSIKRAFALADDDPPVPSVAWFLRAVSRLAGALAFAGLLAAFVAGVGAAALDVLLGP